MWLFIILSFLEIKPTLNPSFLVPSLPQTAKTTPIEGKFDIDADQNFRAVVANESLLTG